MSNSTAVAQPLHSDTHPAHDIDKCCNCGKVATLVCNGCKDLPAAPGNSRMVTRYCTKLCQEEHWTIHKKDCKAAKNRRLIYRVASLTKALFYIHNEITFAWGYFRKIDRYGTIRAIHLHEEKSNGRKALLVPFSTVTDLVSDKNEQEAYLSYRGSYEAMAKFGLFLVARLKLEGKSPLSSPGLFA